MNKFLNNRYAVGVVVLVAAVVVYFNFFRRPAPKKPTAPLAAVAPSDSAKVSASKTSPESQALAGAPIDLTQLDWSKNQLSDPFKRTLSVVEEAQKAVGSAAEILKLSAIWSQKGQRFAVINDRVVGEGESVKGFKIQSIENDSVQVLSPRGPERLGFRSATPRPASQSAATRPANQPIPTPPPASSPRKAPR